jgi:anti-anti-sigma factor
MDISDLLNQTKIEKENIVLEVVSLPDTLNLDPTVYMIIQITGEINLYSCNLVRQFIEKRIETGFIRFFIYASQISYIDSSGLGMFLRFVTQLKSKEGYIRLVTPSRSVTNILELTKLNKLILKFNSLEEAIKRPIL